jgi:sporulation protein YlmC with PRC-barrel domain
VGERAHELKEAEERARASHLRSSEEVIGYRVVATDGAVGHLEDFVIDDADWAITDVIIDPRDWLPGKHVQVPVGAIMEVDWLTREVRLQTAREEVEDAPQA